MPGCRSGACPAIEAHFDARLARRELLAYRRKGPATTTRLLLDALADAGCHAGSLLDIGAGIGTLTFELLEAGLSRATAVDASPASVDIARREAERRGRLTDVTIVQGDFVEVSGQLPQATVVTLDKVVCCYPDVDRLLTEAARHSEEWLALSYPRDRWPVRSVVTLDNGFRRLRGRAFETFVHDPARLDGGITAAGFTRVSRSQTWMWTADVYVRRPASTSTPAA